MNRRIRTVLIFAVILLPSLHFVWKNRDMPQFDYLHDDGVLFVSAKSLANNTYRIVSLPETPYQTQFPPLYPLYLSTVWRLNPDFPGNLRLASLFNWLALAVYLALAWAFYRQSGMKEGKTWLLVALLAVNPYILWISSFLLSDVLFSCWLLATLLVAVRSGVRAALLAGVLGGLAYLSRTAAIALLIAVPGCMLWKREGRRAVAFAGGMLPAVIGWGWWTRTHVSRSEDLTTIFYTDYIRYLMHTTLHDMPVILWKNVDELLYSIGSMVLPRIYPSLPVKILTEVIAVAVITGTVRLVRRRFGVEYAMYALVSAGILLVCNFLTTERYIVPLFPLLLAGLAEELAHIARMFRSAFRHKDRSQRVAAGLMSAVAAAVLLAAAGLQLFMSFQFLPQTAGEKRAKLGDQQSAYTWIKANLPPSATILSYEDPLLYLYTGHRGNHRPLDPL
ncbi:MAG: hypothetical protein EXQ47_09030 [Bryobacterales bacterium]|nr:hypothetical protein [Bryobacterales bacterium]